MIEGYRQAALKLYGMNDMDRKWVLERLQVTERQRLDDLMCELKELGIAPFGLMSDELALHDAKDELLQASGARAGFIEALDLVCAAKPFEMLMLLTSEPDQMIAAVLAAYPWPWRADFVADCGVEKRLRINKLLSQMPRTKARLRVELVFLLAAAVKRAKSEGIVSMARIEHAPRPMQQEDRQPIWKSLRRWLP